MNTTNTTKLKLKEILKEIDSIFKEIPKTCPYCKKRYKSTCKTCTRKLKINSVLKLHSKPHCAYP